MQHIALRSIAIVIILCIANCALAANLAVRVEDWLFVKFEDNDKDQCYAYSVPYRTSLYHGGEERAPYMRFSWHGNNQYTLSVNSGYTLDEGTPIVIETEQNGSYMLNTAYADTGITYSSTQDSYIINNFLDIDDYVQVKSTNNMGAQAIDYYSLRGFVTAMKLMQNNCSGGEGSEDY